MVEGRGHGTASVRLLRHSPPGERISSPRRRPTMYSFADGKLRSIDGMSRDEPRDPDYAARVRASFARQAFMTTLGVEIMHLAPGEVDLGLSYRPDLTQQHGYFHAGVTTTLGDTAAGYA